MSSSYVKYKRTRQRGRQYADFSQNFGFLQTALLKAVYFQMRCSVTTNWHDA